MSAAAAFLSSDGEKYVFKHPGLQSALVAEHVVGRLGCHMGAPCMEVFYGEVPQALIDLDPSLARFKGGLSHATKFIDGLREGRGRPQHFDTPVNRARFAYLAILYPWLQAADHQLMYELSLPNLVYSHDHGLFFPGAHKWTAAGIAVQTTTAAKDPFFDPIALTVVETAAAVKALGDLTDSDIEEAVRGGRPEWGVTAEDLSALSACLKLRKVDLLSRLPKT
jgi:hypothetical protein